MMNLASAFAARTSISSVFRLRRKLDVSNFKSQGLYLTAAQRCWKSSQPAPLMDDEEHIDTVEQQSASPLVSTSASPPITATTTTTTTLTQTSAGMRPRLEALRQKLENDDGRQVVQSFLKNNHDGKMSSGATKKSTIGDDDDVDVDVDRNKDEDILDLIKQLESMELPKQPLMDRYGRQHGYLRISLSEKCNLRCLYCMPEDGVPLQPQSHLLTNDEILRLATWFVQTGGVTKIRLTGGEPLLRKDLIDLISKMNKNLPQLEQIGMTTNGVTLSKQLNELVDAGLTHVNISLDSLDADKFARLTRRPPSYHDRVMQAIEECAQILPNRTKVNCVVMPDNVDELADFAELTRKYPIDIRFIEYMPFNENKWQTDGFVSYQQMHDRIPHLQRLTDGPSDTTKWWSLPNKVEDDTSIADSSVSEPSLGRIGFITSMSDHFCATCNRLRITADGQLKVCLFGKTEVSLRDLLRYEDAKNRVNSKDELLQKIVHYSVQKKHFKLGGHKDMEDIKNHSTENRPMTLIGG